LSLCAFLWGVPRFNVFEHIVFGKNPPLWPQLARSWHPRVDKIPLTGCSFRAGALQEKALVEKAEHSERHQAATTGSDTSRMLSHEANSNSSTISTDVKSQRETVSNESAKLAQNQMLGNISLTGIEEQSANKRATNPAKSDAPTPKPNSKSELSFNDRFAPADSTAQPKPVGYNENFSLYDSQAQTSNSAAKGDRLETPQISNSAAKGDLLQTSNSAAKGDRLETAAEARAQNVEKNTTINGDPNIADKPQFAKEIINSAHKVVAASPEERAGAFKTEAEKFAANHPEAMPSSFSGSMTYAMRQETGNKDLSVDTNGPHVQLMQGPDKHQSVIADSFVGYGKGLADTNPSLRLANSTADKMAGVLNNGNLSNAEMTKQVNDILKSGSSDDLAIDRSPISTQDKLEAFGHHVSEELTQRGFDVPPDSKKHSISVAPGKSYLQVDEIDDSLGKKR